MSELSHIDLEDGLKKEALEIVDEAARKNISNLQKRVTDVNKDLEVERTRIDLITQTNTGANTGENAELIDLRVDANGKIHDTAGGAVRWQFSQLSGEIEDTKKIYTNGIVDRLVILKGKGIAYTNGCDLVDDSTSKVALFPIATYFEDYTSAFVRWTNAKYISNAYRVMFLDENLQKLNAGSYLQSLSVYNRNNWINGNYPTLKYIAIPFDIDIEPDFEEISLVEAIKGIKKDAYNDTLTDSVNEIRKVVENTYLDSTYFVTREGYCSTNLIKAQTGDVIYTNIKDIGISTSSSDVITFLDENLNRISSSDLDYISEDSFTINVANTEYVVLSWKKTDADISKLYAYINLHINVLIPSKIANKKFFTTMIAPQWFGKKWATYGDSITECSGNSHGWQDLVNAVIEFEKHSFRGKGGSEIAYFERSNDITWKWTNPEDSSDVRTVHTAGCMFDRIQTIPQDSDLVFAMFGTNDFTRTPVTLGDCDFDSAEARDTLWQEYATNNGLPTGDFKISTYKGAICSAIMKIQRWCPNAVIVFGTPFSGRGASGTDIQTGFETNSRGETTLDWVNACIEACKNMSTPCIDVFGTTGVNQMNRNLYLKDMVHPSNYKGRKMIARAIIGGLVAIMPMDW